jgi:hypothetical protein
MDTLLQAEILIFKAGYEHFGEVSWDFIRTVHNPEVEWVHEKPRFVLTRMNMQERGEIPPLFRRGQEFRRII